MHIEKLKGTKVLLHWIPEGTDSDAKSGLYLSQKKKTFVPAGKLTFADRGIGELIDIMEKAESEFQEYPSFYGFAIHYYRSFRALSGDTPPVLFSFRPRHGKTSLWTRR